LPVNAASHAADVAVGVDGGVESDRDGGGRIGRQSADERSLSRRERRIMDV
jgi:hypothetical protein